MSYKFFLPIDSVAAANTKEHIQKIFMPRTDHNYYQFICDHIQPLAGIIGGGEKLSCPIYIDSFKYKEILKYFTSGEILNFPKHPVTVAEKGTLWLHNCLIREHTGSLTFAKEIIRKQLQPVPADQVIILQRKHYRKIENFDNICMLTKEVLKISPTVFYPEEHTIEETAKVFQSAKVLIAPHGAGLANTLFMQDNTHVIEVFPPEWTDSTFVRYIKALSSNIQHHQCFQQLNQEDLYKYPKDFVEYRRKQPREVSDKNKHLEYFKIAKDCKVTDGMFSVNEQQLRQILEVI
jgi:hypothetical protein